MNKFLLTSAIVLAGALLLSSIEISPVETDVHAEYRNYLKEYGKEINSDVEFMYRASLFEKFLIKMKKHNSDPSKNWKMGVNQFSDLTQEQFMSTYLGEMNDITPELKDEPINIGFAGEVDWRTKGIVTAVKNQGQCGSCWAFAATAAHESYQVQTRGQPIEIDLSEQQLVDCSTAQPYGNGGCNGGYGVRALEYIKDFGQTVGSEYPYKAVNQPCQTPSGKFKIFGVTEIAGCEEMETVIQRRPMAVRVDASNWHLYKSGIFDDCQTRLNHAVFLIGSSSEAWTIKNSWTANWGESGFIRLKKGNTCGVCFGPSFPV